MHCLRSEFRSCELSSSANSILRIEFSEVSFTFANCVVLHIVSCEMSFANCELCAQFYICKVSLAK